MTTPPLPPSPPRAGATGEITGEPLALLVHRLSQVGIERTTGLGMEPKRFTLRPTEVQEVYGIVRAALLAELAASAGEEVKRLVDGLDLASHRDGWARGHGHDPHADRVRPFYVVEAESALLAHVGHLAAQRDEAYTVGYREALAVAGASAALERAESAPTSTEREGEADLWRRMYNDLRASVMAYKAAAKCVAEGQIQVGIAHSWTAKAIRALGPGDAPAREGP